MPKLPTDYSKTVIYIIKCKDDNILEEYIGSTTNFKQRKREHKSRCYNEKIKLFNSLKYQFIRDNGGWNNWSMIELEKYSCNDKREAEKREEEIRIDRKAKLNMRKAFSSEINKEYIKKYYEEHKEHYKELSKKYREENKEDIKEYNKNYYEENKDRILEHHKKYREEHTEYFKELNKKYKEEHKEEIKEQSKKYYEEHKNKKWTCPICNKEMRELSKNRHNKTIHLEENKISI